MLVIPARVKVVVVMVSALALAAGLLTLTLLSKPAQAQAETLTDIYREPFTFEQFTCFGEDFLFEGTLQTVTHTTLDANGGAITKFQFHLQGQGEGLSSGDKYVFNDIDNRTVNFPTGAELIATFPQTFKIIRQGSVTPTDDFNGKVLSHATVNAQGEVTTVIDRFEVECT